jgi:hypothetical protein
MSLWWIWGLGPGPAASLWWIWGLGPGPAASLRWIWGLGHGNAVSLRWIGGLGHGESPCPYGVLGIRTRRKPMSVYLGIRELAFNVQENVTALITGFGLIGTKGE